MSENEAFAEFKIDHRVRMIDHAGFAFVGAWCAPGDEELRTVKTESGVEVLRHTIAEAARDAAIEMVNWLNEQAVRIDEEFNMIKAGKAIGNAREFVEGLEAITKGQKVDIHA